MNLHGLVRGVIAAVNPDTYITIKRNIGYTTSANGKQAPTYADPVTAPAKIQPMGKGDLRHMAELNITGIFRKVYLYGQWMGVVRSGKTGGDMMTFPLTPGAQVESLPYLAPPQVSGYAYLAAGFTTGSQLNDWKVVDVLETWPDWCAVAVVLQ